MMAPGAGRRPPASDHVLEAGWLLALTLVPLVFEPLAGNAFELPKVVALRLVALAVAGAGLVRLIERLRDAGDPGGPGPGWTISPVVAAALVLTASTVVATLGSVSPQASWTGSADRVQGLATHLAYLVLFLALRASIGRPGALDRLLGALVAVTVPVALYAVLQERCLDLLGWSTDVATRPISTLGNPTFLAGLLAPCVPLTLARLVGFRPGSAAPPVSLPMALGHALALVFQVLAVLHSQSRGAAVGLAAGLAVFGALAVVTRSARPALAAPGRWRRAGPPLLVGAALVAGVALLAWTGIPVARLARLAETVGTARVRLLIWEGVGRLLAGPWPGDAASPADRPGPLRSLVGYGPETLADVFPGVAPAELAHLDRAQVDRSHNALLDALVETGVLGGAASLALVAASLAAGLGGLGLVRRGRGAWEVVAAGLLGAGVAAGLVRGIDASWRFVGVAAPTGLLAAVALVAALRRGTARPPADPASPAATPTLLVGLVSALVVQVVEGQFAVGATGVRLLGWVILALLGALGEPGDRPPAPLLPTPRAGTADGLVQGLVVGAGLAILAWDFWPAPGLGARVSVLAWLAGATWLTGTLLVAASGRQALAAAVAGPAAAAGLVGLMIAVGGPGPAPVPGRVDALAALLGAALAALVAVLAWGAREPARRLSALAVASLAAAVLAVVPRPLDRLRAEVLARGATLAASRNPDAALRAADEATRLAPAEPAYQVTLARVLIAASAGPVAGGSAVGSSRGGGDGPDESLARARAALERARIARPRRTDLLMEVARFEQIWATRRTAVEAEQALDRAAALYEEAGRRAPGDPRPRVEAARLAARRGRPAAALVLYAQAVRADPSYGIEEADPASPGARVAPLRRGRRCP